MFETAEELCSKLSLLTTVISQCFSFTQNNAFLAVVGCSLQSRMSARDILAFCSYSTAHVHLMATNYSSERVFRTGYLSRHKELIAKKLNFLSVTDLDIKR